MAAATSRAERLLVAVLRGEPGRKFKPSELKRQTKIPKALALRLLAGIKGVTVRDGRAYCRDPKRIPPEYTQQADDALVPVEHRTVKFVVPQPNAQVMAQVDRMLRSMQEFGFDPGGAWHEIQGETFQTHWNPRSAGDPIYDTLQEAAGVFASRWEVTEALSAVVHYRQPDLPRRCDPLLAAAVAVGQALAAGRRSLRIGGGTLIRIKGPILP